MGDAYAEQAEALDRVVSHGYGLTSMGHKLCALKSETVVCSVDIEPSELNTSKSVQAHTRALNALADKLDVLDKTNG